MTLEEAIAHCIEVAEQNDKRAEYRPRMDYYDEITSAEECRQCAADHRQLAEWLEDYKLLRGEYYKCQLNSIDDYRREAARCRAAYFKLSSDYSHLTIRQTDTYQELQEAKRLLKLAVEDLEKIAAVDEYSFPYCDSRCPFECIGQCEEKHWKHTDEALKLIGGDDSESTN